MSERKTDAEMDANALEAAADALLKEAEEKEEKTKKHKKEKNPPKEHKES